MSRAVGFGVPGPLDLRGRGRRMVNLPFDDFPLRDHMAERFGLPIGLDNDANAAAIGEWRAGAGRGVDDLVMLTLGTGLGGGVISGGRPFRGLRGAGVELGHVVIVHDGLPVPGRVHGARPSRAVRHRRRGDDGARRRRSARPPTRTGSSASRERETGTALEILAEIGRYLGSGMGSFANIFAPELIVIGGGFGVAGWEFLLPAGRGGRCAARRCGRCGTSSGWRPRSSAPRPG